MSESAKTAAAPVLPAGSVAYFPVTLFAAVMGIGGLSLAWRRAAMVWGTPSWIPLALFWVAAAVFVLVAALYATKWVRYPAAARAELRHPVRMSFAPALTIAILVLAAAGQSVMPTVASVAWWIGAFGHLVATLAVARAWMNRPDIGVEQVTPAWFIPVVGNVVAPLGAETIGSPTLAWMSFGLGVLAWLAVLPLVMHRLLLGSTPLPTKLRPTLGILVAPPAISLVSLSVLVGPALDGVKLVLFGAAVGFAVLVVIQPGQLRLPFGLPFWAYTFPSAALAAAAITVDRAATMASPDGAVNPAYHGLAWVLLVVTTLVVTLVSVFTVRLAFQNRICLPE
ncbi:MAG: C4-dicarboxylate ABC transporter [Actinomycetales bacterium]|nr:MAG: C4-dicarboxylate ABC transporter [Actinomycetales bacterium]